MVRKILHFLVELAPVRRRITRVWKDLQWRSWNDAHYSAILERVDQLVTIVTQARLNVILQNPDLLDVNNNDDEEDNEVRQMRAGQSTNFTRNQTWNELKSAAWDTTTPHWNNETRTIVDNLTRDIAFILSLVRAHYNEE